MGLDLEGCSSLSIFFFQVKVDPGNELVGFFRATEFIKDDTIGIVLELLDRYFIEVADMGPKILSFFPPWERTWSRP